MMSKKFLLGLLLFTFLSKFSFGTANQNVDLTVNSTATCYSPQRSCFYYNGYFYIFYQETDNNVVYRYTNTFYSWTNAAQVFTNANAPSIWVNGSTVYVVAQIPGGGIDTASDIIVKKGTIQSNGRINFGSQYTVLDGDGTTYIWPYITQDTNGYLWVVARDSNRRIVAVRSTNPNNVSSWGSSTPISNAGSTESDYTLGIILPLSGGNMYSIWSLPTSLTESILQGKKYNAGTGWEGTATNLANIEASKFYFFSAVVGIKGNIHLIYADKSTRDLLYRRYNTSSGTWSTSHIAADVPTTDRIRHCNISVNPRTNELYALWIQRTSAGEYPIYCRKAVNPSAAGDWSSETDVPAAESGVRRYYLKAPYYAQDGFMPFFWTDSGGDLHGNIFLVPVWEYTCSGFQFGRRAVSLYGRIYVGTLDPTPGNTDSSAKIVGISGSTGQEIGSYTPNTTVSDTSIRCNLLLTYEGPEGGTKYTRIYSGNDAGQIFKVRDSGANSGALGLDPGWNSVVTLNSSYDVRGIGCNPTVTRLYVGDTDGRLYHRRADNGAAADDPPWEYNPRPLEASIESMPVCYTDNNIYVALVNGTIKKISNDEGLEVATYNINEHDGDTTDDCAFHSSPSIRYQAGGTGAYLYIGEDGDSEGDVGVVIVAASNMGHHTQFSDASNPISISTPCFVPRGPYGPVASVYVASSKSGQDEVWKLIHNYSSGTPSFTRAWRYALGSGTPTSPILPLFNHSKLYHGRDNGGVHCLNSSGTLVDGFPRTIGSTRVIGIGYDGWNKLIFCTLSGTPGKIVALQPYIP
jgi:hypothetical protein